MEVKGFIAFVRNEILPESLAELDECKTVLGAVLWRRRMLSVIGNIKIVGEEDA